MGKERANLERLLQSAYAFQHHPASIQPQKPPHTKKRSLVKRDVFVAIVSLLIPQGWSMSGFGPNIGLAVVCWFVAGLFLTHFVWSRRTWAVWMRSAIVVGSGSVAVLVLWQPTRVEYRKEHPLVTTAAPVTTPVPAAVAQVTTPVPVPAAQVTSPVPARAARVRSHVFPPPNPNGMEENFIGGEFSGSKVAAILNVGKNIQLNFDGTKFTDNSVGVLNAPEGNPEDILAQIAKDQKEKSHQPKK